MARGSRAPSSGLEPAVVDHLRPARALLADGGLEIRGGIPDRNHALLRELRLELVRLEDLRAVAVDLLDHVLRGARGRHEAEPSGVLEAGEHLVGRGDVRQLGAALAAGDGERADLAALDEVDRAAE